MVRVRMPATVAGGTAQTLTAAIDETVDYVLNKAAHVAGLPADQLQLVRLGRMGAPPPAGDQPLGAAFADLRDGHTLVAVLKSVGSRPADTKNEPAVSPVEAEQAYTAMRHVIATPDHALRQMVAKVMANGDMVDLLRAAVPALENDITVQKVICDMALCLNWLNVDDWAALHRAHPTLAAACQFVVSSVHSEYAGRGGPPQAHMVGNHVAGSDDDDDEEEGNAGAEEQARRAEHRARQEADRMRQRARDMHMRQEAHREAAGAPITAAQLAAALAATVAPQQQQRQPAPALPSSSAPPPAASGQGGATGASGTGTTASTDAGAEMMQLLQNALRAAAAHNAGSAAGPAAAAAPPPDYSAQLSQLHAMGFADDGENEAALQAANGDLDAALETIISHREARMQ